MAEKGFGVKEINLIGASGTPTIESPNNLNLNAVNVAISTNVSIGGTLAVTGNVSVGGTLTYEDVTNIDSVGVITARSGVDVDDFISVGSNIHLGNAGVVTATTFSGSAASLTSVPAANITGTLPAISGANLTGITITPTNSDIQVAYTVTANGSSAYRFAGNGVVSTADDPDLYLIRGQKYRFINNSGGSHPFQIREASGGTAYSTGVTNNGASSGNIDFAPTYDSPAQLVYQCTSHSGMVGNIYLRDAAGGNTNVGVTTFTGDLTIPDKIIHSGDTNTAIRFPSADTIQFETSGTQRLQIASTGNFTLGTASAAGNKLYFQSTSGAAQYIASGGTNNQDLIIGSSAGERLRIHSDGKISIGSVETSTGLLLLDKDITAESDVSDKNNYHLVVRSQTNSNTSKIGIAFANTTDDTHVGAAILHHRESTDSIGSLAFYTSPSSGTTTERMKIDRNGHVTTSSQFHIEVQRSGNQTGFDARSSNAGTPVTFNDVVRTRGTANSALNTSTGKITVPVDGVYFLEASAYTPNNNISQGWFTEGSSRMNYSDITEDGNTDQIQCHGMHYLTAGTEVGFHPYGASASSITIEASVNHTWFRVTLIG